MRYSNRQPPAYELDSVRLRGLSLCDLPCMCCCCWCAPLPLPVFSPASLIFVDPTLAFALLPPPICGLIGIRGLVGLCAFACLPAVCLAAAGPPFAAAAAAS